MSKRTHLLGRISMLCLSDHRCTLAVFWRKTTNSVATNQQFLLLLILQRNDQMPQKPSKLPMMRHTILDLWLVKLIRTTAEVNWSCREFVPTDLTFWSLLLLGKWAQMFPNAIPIRLCICDPRILNSFWRSILNDSRRWCFRSFLNLLSRCCVHTPCCLTFLGYGIHCKKKIEITSMKNLAKVFWLFYHLLQLSWTDSPGCKALPLCSHVTKSSGFGVIPRQTSS